ncbi:MAG: CRTAC1 family protein [Planctomycetota bacterium]|nr:CRTAC1 family protein [Planctomycetota bacterium]
MAFFSRVAVAVLALLPGGRSLAQKPSPVTFEERAASAGLDFAHFNGRSGEFFYVESMGGGVCLFDHDGDGWLDIYLVNGAALPGSSTGGGATNALYRNRTDGTFQDVTAGTGVGDPSYSTGACAADYDNDGDVDLYVLNFGPDVLYRNDGDGTFTDVTAEAGLSSSGWSVAGAFLDYDRDGHLDLFVGRYLKYTLDDNRPCRRQAGGTLIRDYCGPDAAPGLSDLLFRNLGDGRFVEVSARVGIAGKPGKAMGVGAADYDGDGWPDLFVANDQMRNYLYRNVRGERFEEGALLAGVAFDDGGGVQASMGVAWGDVDNDGHLDLFVPCLEREVFPLYRNEGDGFFSDVSRRSGIAAATLPHTGFGAILADFDDDGWLDALTSNGAVFAREGTRPGTDSFRDCYGETALLLHNEAGRRFRDISAVASGYFRDRRVGRGAACGDLFNDGRISVVISNNGGRPALLRNTTPRRADRHWLTVRVIGRKSNRDGIGARITVLAGGRRYLREVAAGGSVFSQNDSRPHFGLGEAARAERIDIVWPSGIRQTLRDVRVDRVLTVTEPEG